MVATSGCRATHTNKVCLLSILQQVWTRLNQSESRTGTIPFGISILEYCELILTWVRVLRPLCHAEDVSANLRRFKQNNNRKVKVMWHTAKYDDQYSEFVLCNYPSKCTHIAVNTHTVNSHPEQWAAIYAAAHGEQLGVRCLAQGHLVVVLKVERVLYIHSPHPPPPWQSLPDRDSNSQTYESDSLPLGHDFPHDFPKSAMNWTIRFVWTKSY